MSSDRWEQVEGYFEVRWFGPGGRLVLEDFRTLDLAKYHLAEISKLQTTTYPAIYKTMRLQAQAISD